MAAPKGERNNGRRAQDRGGVECGLSRIPGYMSVDWLDAFRLACKSEGLVRSAALEAVIIRGLGGVCNPDAIAEVLRGIEGLPKTKDTNYIAKKWDF